MYLITKITEIETQIKLLKRNKKALKAKKTPLKVPKGKKSLPNTEAKNKKAIAVLEKRKDKITS